MIEISGSMARIAGNHPTQVKEYTKGVGIPGRLQCRVAITEGARTEGGSTHRAKRLEEETSSTQEANEAEWKEHYKGGQTDR